MTDALLGAAALGDIGMHFPDTDPQWKGADSQVFLAHAAKLVREAGYDIINIDTTVILERPKLKDYRLMIRESLSRTLEIGVQFVSVKFKTAERVGAGGRREIGRGPGHCHSRRLLSSVVYLITGLLTIWTAGFIPRGALAPQIAHRAEASRGLNELAQG